MSSFEFLSKLTALPLRYTYSQATYTRVLRQKLGTLIFCTAQR